MMRYTFITIFIQISVISCYSSRINRSLCRAYGKAGIRNLEPVPEPEPEPELKLRPGKLGSTETSSRYPCGNKFKTASSVIIVLRNFQHSDRDTKDILTFGKWLAKKKSITSKIQRISPCCSAADSSINSRHNNFTFSHVLTFQLIRRFVAICKWKQICFCKMVTFFQTQ